VRAAAIVNAGRFTSDRRATRRSCLSISMTPSAWEAKVLTWLERPLTQAVAPAPRPASECQQTFAYRASTMIRCTGSTRCALVSAHKAHSSSAAQPIKTRVLQCRNLIIRDAQHIVERARSPLVSRLPGGRKEQRVARHEGGAVVIACRDPSRACCRANPQTELAIPPHSRAFPKRPQTLCEARVKPLRAASRRSILADLVER
jgi:hypothetical protein